MIYTFFQEARIRGTSVYLADRRIDMLPTVLSENLCSLRAQQDRLAMSVLWVFNKQKQLVRTWFGRTIIRSAYELDYGTAQAILQDSLTDEQKYKFKNYESIHRSMNLLFQLATFIRVML